MKRFSFLICALLVALLISSCVPQPVAAPTATAPAAPAPTATQAATATPTPELPTPTPVSAYPLTITDAAGRQVTISAQPKAIVSLAPSNTEILYALGLGDRVVGVTKFCNYPPEATQKPQVGGFSDVSVEKVAELQPDLVLAARIHIPEVVPALEKLGLTVVVLDPPDVPGVLEGIALVGRITGAEGQASALIESMQARIDAVSRAVAGRERPRVFWELSNDLWTAGPGSFINDLIERAGGQNIAATGDSPWLQLSSEAVVEADPQVIFLADHPFGESAQTVASRAGWEEVSAVKEGRIVELQDTDIFSRPGPRVVEALELIAKALHPEAFQ
jgi:iron complex transport system substrate-binding protein